MSAKSLISTLAAAERWRQSSAPICSAIDTAKNWPS
jgi:hypothetical protein